VRCLTLSVATCDGQILRSYFPHTSHISLFHNSYIPRIYKPVIRAYEVQQVQNHRDKLTACTTDLPLKMVRRKFRYIIAQFDDLCCPKAISSQLTWKNVKKAITDTCENNFGTVASALLYDKLTVKYLDMTSEPQYVVLKCDRDHTDIVRATLTFLTHLQGKTIRCSLRVVSLKGSVRTGKLAAIRYLRNRVILSEKECRDNNAANEKRGLDVSEFTRNVNNVLEAID